MGLRFYDVINNWINDVISRYGKFERVHADFADLRREYLIEEFTQISQIFAEKGRRREIERWGEGATRRQRDRAKEEVSSEM